MCSSDLNGTFTYAPNLDFNGIDSFTYVVNDGALDSNIATVNISVASVNDAPEGQSNTVTTLEDTPYQFQVADFGYSDLHDNPANALMAVIVESLPVAGSLTLNNLVVTAGQHISVNDISAGLLQFASAADANGMGYANFAFRVQDTGGVTNGGVDTDLLSKIMTIDVTPVNDAPEAINSAVIGQEDTPYIFSWAELQITDIDSNSLSVVINSLPTEGFLQYDDGLNWIAVTLGQVISKADIEAGKFCFGPEANAAGYDGYAAVGTGNLKLDYASFTYQGFDGELLSNQVTMTIDIVQIGRASCRERV